MNIGEIGGKINPIQEVRKKLRHRRHTIRNKHATAQLNPDGTSAHTIPIGGRPRCGSSRHKHHTVVAMADSYGGGNDNARQCRVEREIALLIVLS
jgi:hypothetical protein